MTNAEETRQALLAEQAQAPRAADVLAEAQALLDAEMRSSTEQIDRMYGNG